MRKISQGERLPWGWGYCWTSWQSMTFVIAPIPLNFLLRWVRSIYFYLASPQRAKHDEGVRKIIHTSYLDGYNRGEIVGKKETIKEVGRGLEGGIKGLENMIDKWREEGNYFDPPQNKL